MKSLEKILVVAGGSGGHIFPAIGLCQEIMERRAVSSITFVTNQAKMAIGAIDRELHPVFLKTQRSFFGFLKLVIQSLFLIIRIKPDIVVGFGGYVSVPFILWAKILRKRTLIHEQNVVLGGANGFLRYFADKVAISFSETQKFFGDHAKNVFLCRYPLRKSLKRINKKEALSFFGFSEDFFTILVVGGSQGAHAVNQGFCESVCMSKNLHRLQIIHISGARDFSFVKECYGKLSVGSKVFDFLPSMEYAYSAADLVVARSGAGSVKEILFFAIPSILIPYPHAQSHQVENAKVLARAGAALFLEEAKMTPLMIGGLLDILVDDRMRCQAMSSAAASLQEAGSRRSMSEIVLQESS